MSAFSSYFFTIWAALHYLTLPLILHLMNIASLWRPHQLLKLNSDLILVLIFESLWNEFFHLAPITKEINIPDFICFVLSQCVLDNVHVLAVGSVGHCFVEILNHLFRCFIDEIMIALLFEVRLQSHNSFFISDFSFFDCLKRQSSIFFFCCFNLFVSIYHF